MQNDIEILLQRLREIEDEFEKRVAERGVEFAYEFRKRRIVFEEAIAAEHRQARTGVIEFLRASPLSSLVVAPVLYAFIIPLILLDLMTNLYQRVCFPIWGIRRLPRADFVRMDRVYLSYLNGIQKLNCVFCSYATGVLSWVREVASITEQFWCPIKHALRVKSPHRRYGRFLDYGDTQDLEQRMEDLRSRLRE